MSQEDNEVLNYITYSNLISLIFTFVSMYTYHLSFKKLCINNSIFSETFYIIITELDTYFEIFLVYFISSIITLIFFSFTTTILVIIIECMIIWHIIYVNLKYKLINLKYQFITGYQMKDKFWSFIEYAVYIYIIRDIRNSTISIAKPWQYQLSSLIWIAAQIIYWKDIILFWR